MDTNGQNVTWATALTSSGGSLAKTGSGVLTLTAANSFAGGTTVSGGALVLNETGGPSIIAANSNLTISGGTVSLQGNQYNAINNNNSGTVTINAGGLLSANVTAGNNAHNLFNLVLNGGALAASQSSNWSSGSQFAINGAVTATGSQTSTISANLTAHGGNGGRLAFNVATASSLLLSGAVSNAADQANVQLLKTGAGTLTLDGSAVNNYTGGTTVNAGTLLLDYSQPGQRHEPHQHRQHPDHGRRHAGINGNASSPTRQTFASLAVKVPGASTIALTANGGQTNTLTITSSAVSKANGGALNFVLARQHRRSPGTRR